MTSTTKPKTPKRADAKVRRSAKDQAAATNSGRCKTAKHEPAAKLGARAKGAARAAKPAPNASPPASRETKHARLIGLLKTDGGADIATLATTLGWLPHTTRAALTRLRKAGYGIERRAGEQGFAARYRITTEPAA